MNVNTGMKLHTLWSVQLEAAADSYGARTPVSRSVAALASTR